MDYYVISKNSRKFGVQPHIGSTRSSARPSGSTKSSTRKSSVNSQQQNSQKKKKILGGLQNKNVLKINSEITRTNSKKESKMSKLQGYCISNQQPSPMPSADGNLKKIDIQQIETKLSESTTFDQDEDNKIDEFYRTAIKQGHKNMIT